MTRKRRRLYGLLLGLGGVGAAAALTLSALEENITLFFSPSDLETAGVAPDRFIRVGGLVAEGSLAYPRPATTRFDVSDGAAALTIEFVGELPALFREGQGIVAQGRLGPDGVFRAEEVLAKHDENYMPPEVADALKRSGEWREALE
ncbi:MAG: cytochrome c maturation protein CcmE [Pseudomonadota bacterium]